MNFERIPTSEESEKPKEQSVEKESGTENWGRQAIRCVRRLAATGALVSSIFVAAEMKEEYFGKKGEYRDHISRTLSPEEREEKNELMDRVASDFGEDAKERIEKGDMVAFFEKQEARKMPELHGFDKEKEESFKKYVLTDNYLLWPKGWLDGEVGEVAYNPKEVSGHTIKGQEAIVGGFFMKIEKSPTSSYPAIVLNGEQGTDLQVITHELAHANDWENDMDLNILDRAKLLLAVKERIENQAKHAQGLDQDQRDYYQSYGDGTKNGEYRAAKEYWASICEKFFNTPENFQKASPEDFALVQEYARKNQSDFNVLNENRGAFDPKTGEIKTVWQDLENKK